MRANRMGTHSAAKGADDVPEALLLGVRVARDAEGNDGRPDEGGRAEKERDGPAVAETGGDLREELVERETDDPASR
jgi:hypothetical protein